MPESKADLPSESKEAGLVQPLEIVFSAALTGFASLIKDPAWRALASVAAPPLGYVLVKSGRWLPTYWVPKWTAETPESRARTYIEEARKKLKRKDLSAAERRQTELYIRQLEEALQQRRLQDLQVTDS